MCIKVIISILHEESVTLALIIAVTVTHLINASNVSKGTYTLLLRTNVFKIVQMVLSNQLLEYVPNVIMHAAPVAINLNSTASHVKMDGDT